MDQEKKDASKLTEVTSESNSVYEHRAMDVDPDPDSANLVVSLRQAELMIADQIGRIADFWGMKRVHGRVWAILFLADKPLANAQIQERLGISTGAASMALTELRRWGAVKEATVFHRAVHYEPETNVWRVVSRVMHQRERQLLLDTLDVFERALAIVRRSTAAESQGLARRVERLVWVTRVVQSMLQVLLDRGEVDVDSTLNMRV